MYYDARAAEQLGSSNWKREENERFVPKRGARAHSHGIDTKSLQRAIPRYP